MTSLFSDITNMLSKLSLIDFILYFAVILLIILVVSLIYVMLNDKDEDLSKEVVEIKEENKLPEETVVNKEEDIAINLEEIMDKLGNAPKNVITLTPYEEEQEAKAIISYEELLKDAKLIDIKENEELIDNTIAVKKLTSEVKDFDPLEEISRLTNEEVITNQSMLFTYEKEEAFLSALKELDKALNH